MVKQATERAAERGARINFETVSWGDLSACFGEEFDIAFCVGNSIGHCRNEAEMLSSLSGIRNVLKGDGVLVVTSRNWEKLRVDKPRFSPMGLRVRDGLRCIPLYVWNHPPDWEDELIIEVVLLFENAGQVSHRSYCISYYPFRHEELRSRLEQAGFRSIESDYDRGKDRCVVTARVG